MLTNMKIAVWIIIFGGFSVLSNFFIGFSVLMEILAGFPVSDRPQYPPHLGTPELGRGRAMNTSVTTSHF